MKRRILCLLIVPALLAGVAQAQPLDPNCYVGIHFQNNLGAMAYSCTTGVDSFFVYAESVDDWFYSWEFMIDYPPCFIWLGDSPVSGVTVSSGNSTTGIQLGWGIYQNGFYPGYNLLLKVTFMCTCAATDILMAVVPHPVSGKLQYADNTPLRKTWECVGLTSVINPSTIATKPSTWGKIKKLYTQD